MATKFRSAAVPLPAVEELRERFRYDPDTGILTYAKDAGTRFKAGSVAGTIFTAPDGYRSVAVIANGRRMLAHRIAWKMHHGSEPAAVLDHKNGDGTDNRIDNLREATALLNGQNKSVRKDSATGISGVHFNKQKQKYAAQVRVNGKKLHLGLFDNVDDAATARAAAVAQHFGAFAASSREIAHHGN